jgi:fatty acid-binding protein DegV
MSRPVFAAMAHASAPEWGGRLKEALTETFNVVEMLEGEIGPVIGAHSGPGTVGCIVFEPREDELELLKAQD